MRSIEFAPSAWLRPYVQLLWCWELEAPLGGVPPERIVPDGIVELVFHYREPMAVGFAGKPFAPQPRSSLVFQTRRFLEIRAQGSTGLVSVRFRPWGAQHFLGLPVSELGDHVVAAEEVWGGAVHELEEQLGLASTTRQRVRLVERFLLGQLRQHQKADVEPLVRAVWKRKGHAQVAQLCAELGLTERTLQRIFAATLGMPPRSFLRLARFLHACSALRRARWNTLTQVGHDCGYYDQAHFIGDFQALAGMTPGEFAASRTVSFLELS